MYLRTLFFLNLTLNNLISILMKRITIVIFIFFSVLAFGQVPGSLNYQAVIRDVSGVIIPNTPVNVKLTILQGNITGIPVCLELFNPTTNNFGVVTLAVGSVNTTDFSAIDWAIGPYFIKVEVDPTGTGLYFADMGTSQLVSVPYALHAKTAESLSPGLTENDPVFISSPAGGIVNSDILYWNEAFGWGNHASAGYLTSYTEMDPVFTVHPSYGISSNSIDNWNLSYSWGNHATAGYLTIYTETDPLWSLSPSFGITNTNILNWSTAFGWGNHATAGYLTSYTETDPLWSASPSFGITNINITNWSTAFGWGNHATVGYLTSFTETDPLWTTSPSFGITNTNITNWNTAYSWGNHATAGYLTNYNETDPLWTAAIPNYYTKTNMQTSGQSQLHWGNVTNKPTTVAGYGITNAMTTTHPANAITAANITNWNTAFGWGNHATMGYLTSANDLSSNLWYPDGTNNITPVSIVLSSNYTVPSGKNLYIINRFTGCGSLNLIAINSYNIDKYDFHDFGYSQSIIIAGEGDIISSSCSISTINGFLTDAIITPITIMLSTSTDTYTVPSGKTLVILYIYKHDGSGPTLKINNNQVYASSLGATLVFPFFAKSNDVLSSSSLNLVINGYLK